jgi:hypothetical protein
VANLQADRREQRFHDYQKITWETKMADSDDWTDDSSAGDDIYYDSAGDGDPDFSDHDRMPTRPAARATVGSVDAEEDPAVRQEVCTALE